MSQTEMCSKLPSYDAYFEAIQSKKKLPYPLQESLTFAFAQIPVSSFPLVPGGKVIEISGDASIIEAVSILSKHNIMASPVRIPGAENSSDWKERYLGIIDYASIILWVLENADIAAAALAAGAATAAGVGVGAVGALGAVALGATGPVAVAGLAIAAVGAAVAGGVAVEKGTGKDAPTAADHLGDDFYEALIQEEPFKSTTVKSVVETYHRAPFLPIGVDSSMLTVLLLLSKYRLRNVPVVETGNPQIKNFVTQTAIIKGLQQCRGRDWFDCIASFPISDLGLPFMSSNEVISVRSDELILEAFKRMKDYCVGGLPVVEGPKSKIVGGLSIRDIRFLLLKPGLFAHFRQLTVMDFLKMIQSPNLDTENHFTAQPVTCQSKDCLGDIIDKLASKSVHRIYVVEGDEQEVVGVVTLRDVISCFIYEPLNHFDNNFTFALVELKKQ